MRTPKPGPTAEPEPAAEARSGPKPAAEAPPEAEPRSGPELESGPGPEAEARSGTELESGPGPKPEARSGRESGERRGRTHGRYDRGQAYTLEGLVGSAILLAALLLALQSVIVTPTTRGEVDPAMRTELAQQAEDILVLAARDGENDLSTAVRNWSQREFTFTGAVNRQVGYGGREPPGALGVMLNRTFTQRGHLYNVEVRYLPENMTAGTRGIPMVYRGQPSSSSVVASYTVTLYDNQTLTAPNTTRNVELREYDTNATNGQDGYYPIPNAVDGPVYNVVEVRLVVW